MTKQTMLTLPSAMVEAAPSDWPKFPTETEIYILPDGRIIVADLPAELAGLLVFTQPGATTEVTNEHGI